MKSNSLKGKIGRRDLMDRVISAVLFFLVIVVPALWGGYDLMFHQPLTPTAALEHQMHEMMAKMPPEERQLMLSPPYCWRYHGTIELPVDQLNTMTQAELDQFLHKSDEIDQRWFGIPPVPTFLARFACKRYFAERWSAP